MIEFRRILCCVLLLISHSHTLLAEESTAVTEAINSGEGDPAMVQSQGNIDGFQTLSVADQTIAATFIDDQLGENYGAVILLHDVGQGIDSTGVISTLRHQLPQSGWATLTLELHYPYEPTILLSPTLAIDIAPEAGTESTETPTTEPLSTDPQLEQQSEDKNIKLPVISNQQRVEAALALLTAKNIGRIVLLGHGQGGVMAVTLLDVITTPMMGLILVATPELGADKPFETMQQPILDVYGERDEISIVNSVQHRKLLMKRKGNNNFSERRVVAADHNFTGVESVLMTTIRGWLRTQFVNEKSTQ
ncbi:MAG: DUF3530 family protein [Gammaproteobacteria bacterium]|nr:DUF3530 family protein [Gammaproteobacteria bacterium]